MDEQVLVNLKSVQKVGDKEEVVDLVAEGTYKLEEGKHVIKYDEFDSESNFKTKNILKFNNNKAEIERNGEFAGTLTFEVGERNESLYSTPFGELFWEVVTEDINLNEKDDEISLKIRYELYAQNEKVSDHIIDLKVMEKI